jgi:uncharacterized protein YndB with AHSA1/START domain
VSEVVRVTRTLRAPARDVFDAWTDAARLREWLNPGPGTLAQAEADPVVGGGFRFVKLTADGVDEVTGRYLVVEPPHRLVFTWQSPASTGDAESRVTVTLRALPAADPEGETTEMTILHERLPGAYYLEGARRAWTVMAGKLPAVLAGRVRRSGTPGRAAGTAAWRLPG